MARALAARDGDEGDVALLVDGRVAVAGVRPARVAFAEGRDLEFTRDDVVRRRYLIEPRLDDVAAGPQIDRVRDEAVVY